MADSNRINRIFFSRKHDYAIGRISADATSPLLPAGGTYFTIPMQNSLVGYSEIYSLPDHVWTQVENDEAYGGRIADECRARQHDDWLTLGPAPDRGTPMRFSE